MLPCPKDRTACRFCIGVAGAVAVRPLNNKAVGFQPSLNLDCADRVFLLNVLLTSYGFTARVAMKTGIYFESKSFVSAPQTSS